MYMGDTGYPSQGAHIQIGLFVNGFLALDGHLVHKSDPPAQIILVHGHPHRVD